MCLKLIIFVLFSWFAFIYSLRIPHTNFVEDVNLTEKFAEELSSEINWNKSSLQMNETEFFQFVTAKKAEIDRYLYRKSMWEKLQSLNNKQVKVINPHAFNQRTFLKRLPSEGAILFVLDDPFNSICESSYADLEFLQNPKILAIAAENWIGSPHPKVTILPIGFESRLMTGQKGKVLKTFLDLIQHPVATNQRKHQVQSDAHLHKFRHPQSRSRNDRWEMEHDVERSAIDDWYTRHVDMQSHFMNHVAQAKLALCPEGNGLDTHRFYHNYALRTRCIVRKGALSEMHSQFPGTIVVNSWKEVTAPNITKWLAVNFAYDPMLITSDYWIQKVLRKLITLPE